MKKIILAAVSVVILGAVQVSAQPYINKRLIIVDYVDVVNPFMTPLEKKDILKRSMSFLRASGVRAKLGARYNVQDPFSSKRLSVDNTDARFREEFDYWQRKVSNLRKRKHILFVMAPPWTFGNKLNAQGWPNGGKIKIGGFAETGTIRRGCIAFGSASAIQIGGKSLKEATEAITNHELTHCLGASHDNSVPNFMNELIPSTGGYLFFTPRTLGEIKSEIGNL